MNLSRGQVLKIIRMADTQRERARKEFGTDDTFEHFVCLKKVSDDWNVETGILIYSCRLMRFIHKDKALPCLTYGISCKKGISV